MLIQSHRQEGLSRAYVQAVAAACGMSYSVPNPDYGIDLTLNDIVIRDSRHTPSGFRLDVQAKSTTRAHLETDVVKYDLEVKAYDDLRAPDVPCPRILVVLVMPDQEKDWLTLNEDNLILRYCAYWHSLCGAAATTNEYTVRVLLPRTHVFSVEGLLALMDRVKKGLPL